LGELVILTFSDCLIALADWVIALTDRFIGLREVMTRTGDQQMAITDW
jgi:hypothetical protein